MENTQVWYIEPRAEQLAFVYLSRRDDLVIAKQNDDYGVDFLVSVLEDGNYTGRVFGVQVKAKLSLEPTQEDTSTNNFKLNLGELLILEDIPFPLCLFVFAMEDDEGYYRWLKEPRFNSQGNSELVLNKVNEFKKLSNAELDSIVSQINLWYERKNRHTIAA
jgi:hypothetical protein